MEDFEVQITTHGPVGEELRAYAEEKLRRAASIAPRPVLFARLTLSEETNPAIARPAVAKATLDVSGQLIRSHVAAERMHAAVDLLEERLRRRLEILREHRRAARTEPTASAPGEWRHGSLPAQRPEYYPRPVEEREIVRHKTYEVADASPEEAALDLELLDYDFHLFTNAETGDESVVHRSGDGTLALDDDPETETVDEAIARLELTGEPFVFFRDPATGRGNVLYHRYDGHYGLITPWRGESP
jgi:ribosome-associated translation inhibitor RaiA